MFTINEAFEKNPKMMREIYCDTLIELALDNEDIMLSMPTL